MPAKTPPTGDPVWLEDVLRPALGDRLRTLPGWQNSGVGGLMGQIWGVMWHHTGNARETAQSIRNGRPDLPGPLAQLHIAPDGTVTIVAVGPCNHGGRGSWPGLPTDGANRLTIGIECAWPSDTTITEETQTREPWPAAQLRSMIDVGAALTAHLGVDASHNISHHEWATQGPAGWRQGKWDPGNLDMNWFRGEITKTMTAQANPPAATPGGTVPAPTNDDKLNYVFGQLQPYPQLAGKPEALDALRRKIADGLDLTMVDAVAAHIHGLFVKADN
ncbi:N-acetylmuramoyl-L-alanine amidase [Mycolicibacter sp. MYC098]|uniref:N-acetylmuramoyl-L-alanine amidase n=1 Tax=[Mycobacterium] crassicus TaxID=2872309 RepID=A0ABU5XGT1_9MYCO|nr:N-acetylmuramoyl-L-alanine amidase [Mycolicibacter sp. MYC098]MEB3021324.1 N-acetylmuramoyl-L-alanine amidase [Mycolicibacter sp. MYC098]